ncbi:hypothetical protein HPB51_001910 [Rhipicephalus microplus]|uniref:Uncharacterized protein n=1 Tax=Rhipicephalus microplus TaxID=6941 RepID=A0A9J6DXT5_RHIMP|nr:hypothetical protein HPB51_001910 [Rhipicephalus microplus]
MELPPDHMTLTGLLRQLMGLLRALVREMSSNNSRTQCERIWVQAVTLASEAVRLPALSSAVSPRPPINPSNVVSIQRLYHRNRRRAVRLVLEGPSRPCTVPLTELQDYWASACSFTTKQGVRWRQWLSPDHFSRCMIGTLQAAFKLPQFNNLGHPLLHQPFIDNCGTVTSFTTRSIKPLPEDRLFSGLRCSSNSTMFIRCLLFMLCFAGLADLNFWDVTSSDTGSHGSAQSVLAGHMDVTECLPWDCHISPLWNGAFASAFKLPQFNDRGHTLLDQPFIDNCGTVTSFTPRSIKLLPEDRLFSGLRGSSNSTMFNRCLLFMQALIANRLPRIIACSMVLTAITLQLLFANFVKSVPLLDLP